MFARNRAITLIHHPLSLYVCVCVWVVFLKDTVFSPRKCHLAPVHPSSRPVERNRKSEANDVSWWEAGRRKSPQFRGKVFPRTLP